jgi:hypothetical protein
MPYLVKKLPNDPQILQEYLDSLTGSVSAITQDPFNNGEYTVVIFKPTIEVTDLEPKFGKKDEPF